LIARARQAAGGSGAKWSTRRAAAEFGVGHSTVAALWRRLESEGGRVAASSPREQQGRRALGRTAAGLRSAVENAGLELLAAGGLEAVTLTALAERIGVHPRALSRRWGGTDEILAEVVAPALRRRAPSSPAPAGLAAFLRRTAERYAENWHDAIAPAFLRSLIDRRAVDPAVARAAERVSQEGIASFLEHFAQACDPSELREGVDPLLALEIIFGTVMSRSAHGSRPVDAHFIDELVSLLLDGIRARPAER
jgi:AcrR family transcriptional regulator